MYNHVGLFAGLGGFLTAAQRLGIQNTFVNEVDKDAVATLKINFPETIVSSCDIRNLKIKQTGNLISNIDILTAGFPCQSFSQAGTNLGFDDDRGKLFFEIPRFISDCPKPPRVVLLENVAFLKNFSNGSRLRTIFNAMRKCGYWVDDHSTAILDSSLYSHSPQRRKRLFIICVHRKYYRKNHFVFPDKYNGKKTLLWDMINRSHKGPDSTYLPDNNKYKYMIEKVATESRNDRLFQIRRVNARACSPGICPTLTANMGGGGHNVPFLFDNWGIRRLTVSECALLQGFRSQELLFPHQVSENNRYTMLGNAVTVDVAEILMKKIIETIFESDG